MILWRNFSAFSQGVRGFVGNDEQGAVLVPRRRESRGFMFPCSHGRGRGLRTTSQVEGGLRCCAEAHFVEVRHIRVAHRLVYFRVEPMVHGLGRPLANFYGLLEIDAGFDAQTFQHVD